MRANQTKHFPFEAEWTSLVQRRNDLKTRVVVSSIRIWFVGQTTCVDVGAAIISNVMRFSNSFMLKMHMSFKYMTMTRFDGTMVPPGSAKSVRNVLSMRYRNVEGVLQKAIGTTLNSKLPYIVVSPV